MSKFLFEEFEPVSAKQWKQKIQFDLKGADFNQTLVWQSLEGIHVKPFYHQEDAVSPYLPITGQPTHWNITQHIFIDKPSIANKLALQALEKGAEALYFTANEPFDIATVFGNFPVKKAIIYFDLKFLDPSFQVELFDYLKNLETVVHYNVDPLGNLISSGNWFHNQLKDHEILEKLISENTPKHLLGIDTGIYQNAGANMVQQLAYGLAHANEYLNFCHNKAASYLNTEAVFTFKVAVGSNYFFEIAKIRALRKLYQLLASSYKTNEHCNIIATPSKRNKTVYDYNVNMLRTTTECMSAILGGANAVINLPYDALYHKSNEFGERISRNQLIILKKESYLDLVANPSDGSYYIERLTQELAEKALVLFKDIEKNGGLLSMVKTGTIQKKIKESAQKEQQLFDEGALVLVGTNKYQDHNDRMKEELELYPFMKVNPRQTVIAPVIEKRISEKTEKIRLENE